MKFISEQHTTLYARNCTKAIQADVSFFSRQLNILHCTRIHVRTHPFIHAILVTWMNCHTQKQTHTQTQTHRPPATRIVQCAILFSHAICTQMHVGTICVIWTYTPSMSVHHIASHGFFALKSHITSFAARL